MLYQINGPEARLCFEEFVMVVVVAVLRLHAVLRGLGVEATQRGHGKRRAARKGFLNKPRPQKSSSTTETIKMSFSWQKSTFLGRRRYTVLPGRGTRYKVIPPDFDYLHIALHYSSASDSIEMTLISLR